jgi:hypothetical protein
MLNKRINPSYKLGEFTSTVALSAQTLPREVYKCILPNYNLPNAVYRMLSLLMQRPMRARELHDIPA